MDVLSYGDSALSLVTPTAAIILAVLTRKVILSLGIGIIVGSLLLTNYHPLQALLYILQDIISLFWDHGFKRDNIFILLFLVLLGIITSLISLSGGTQAFGRWAKNKIKSRQGSQVLAVVLGIIIFIDDYFNSLVVGNVSRPLTDQYCVSRAKLAYLIDSTAAPVCAIVPVSSWGAYIIAISGSIMASHGVTNITPIGAFMEMIPMNLYAVFGIGLVFATAYFDLNVGPMRYHEQQAMKGNLYDHSKGVPPGASEQEPHEKGRVLSLIMPIIVLVLCTLVAMIWTGAEGLVEQGKTFSILGAFENTIVSDSLVYGALSGLAVTVLQMLNHKLSSDLWFKAIIEGVRSMLPAIYILIFAWVLTGIIGHLETGKFLASLITGALPTSFLPMILFIVSGTMAFATGTSWGAFGILLPIAGDMAAAADITMLVPMLAAVLAGSVFGDHCSPISDTTILSSAGASCHHMDHVTTQLPYALTIALVSMLGYLVMGLTESATMGFIAAFVAFVLVVLVFKRLSKGQFSESSTREAVS